MYGAGSDFDKQGLVSYLVYRTPHETRAESDSRWPRSQCRLAALDQSQRSPLIPQNARMAP